jgi:hypothetical protein
MELRLEASKNPKPGTELFYFKENTVVEKLTFAGVVAELEKAVYPIGFRIEAVERKRERVQLTCGHSEKDADEEKLVVYITRAGIIPNRVTFVSLSDNPDKVERGQ